MPCLPGAISAAPRAFDALTVGRAQTQGRFERPGCGALQVCASGFGAILSLFRCDAKRISSIDESVDCGAHRSRQNLSLGLPISRSESVQLELAVDRANFCRLDQARMRHDDPVQWAFELFQPKVQKLITGAENRGRRARYPAPAVGLPPWYRFATNRWLFDAS